MINQQTKKAGMIPAFFSACRQNVYTLQKDGLSHPFEFF
nr:MAG TPA: hypothetical protein [Caudoviricetes sp.]